jgi:site-specific recombinase XerD
VELTVVGAILGHESPKTTMRYGAVTTNFIKEELARKLLA